MFNITLKPWQSAVLHGAITFIGSGITLYLAGHPDIANMTIAGVFAAIWNLAQGTITTDRSA